MPQAIRFHETGGPEVLRLENVEVADPGPGQARVRHSFIAVNFIDIYFRTGRYPLALPDGLGSDAVGVVEAVGPGVTEVKPGDRVGYLIGPQGAYSQVRVMPTHGINRGWVVSGFRIFKDAGCSVPLASYEGSCTLVD